MSLNNITLTGRICHSLELKATSTDKSVCNFNLAVDDGFGENKKTLFISIVCWNGQADYVSKYGSKGDLIAVSGRLSQREYTNREGTKVKVFEVVANSIQLMSKPKDSSANIESNTAAQHEIKTPYSNSNSFIEVDLPDDLPF